MLYRIKYGKMVYKSTTKIKSFLVVVTGFSVSCVLTDVVGMVEIKQNIL